MGSMGGHPMMNNGGDQVSGDLSYLYFFGEMRKIMRMIQKLTCMRVESSLVGGFEENNEDELKAKMHRKIMTRG